MIHMLSAHQRRQSVILGLARLLAMVLWIGSAIAEEPRPNVLLILVDNQSYFELSCHGHAHLKTPHIDQLASESVDFVNFHAPPFFETSFEDGMGDWSVSGDGTPWEFGTPTSGPGAANTGVGVAATGLADDTAVQLRTPVIDPGETTRVTLEFWYYLQAARGDGGQISLLEADGTLIQNLVRLYLCGDDDTTEWTQESLRLNLEPARPFVVQFAFLSVDDRQPNNGSGWLLDDVRIGK